MISLALQLNDLHQIAVEIEDATRGIKSLSNSGLSPDFEADQRDRLTRKLLEERARRESYVRQRLITFPPHHSKHYDKLDEFWNDGKYEESVFIMTSFPGSNPDKDVELTQVIDAVRGSVIKQGYKPRLASDKKYDEMLWYNVELYLIGCKRGVAIIEDTYRKELNPNVAMEWGWMRGMGKEVIFLLEKSFSSHRADWKGLITDEFDWNNPAVTVTSAIVANLKSR
jgi:hypothetical protein